MENTIRMTLVCCVLACWNSSTLGQTPDRFGEPDHEPKFATVGKLTEKFRTTISRSITFDASFVKPKLGPYLEKLCDESEVTLVISTLPFKKFRGELIPVDLTIDGIGRGKMKAIDALEHLVVQFDSVLIPRRDYFEIVPREWVIEEALGAEKTKEYVASRSNQPKVAIARQELTIQDALSKLEAASKRKFKLDRRIAEQFKNPIEVAVTNQPVDTAAVMIAKLAGLTIVKVDDVSVLTTDELAGSLVPR